MAEKKELRNLIAKQFKVYFTVAGVLVPTLFAYGCNNINLYSDYKQCNDLVIKKLNKLSPGSGRKYLDYALLSAHVEDEAEKNLLVLNGITSIRRYEADSNYYDTKNFAEVKYSITEEEAELLKSITRDSIFMEKFKNILKESHVSDLYINDYANPIDLNKYAVKFIMPEFDEAKILKVTLSQYNRNDNTLTFDVTSYYKQMSVMTEGYITNIPNDQNHLDDTYTKITEEIKTDRIVLKLNQLEIDALNQDFRNKFEVYDKFVKFCQESLLNNNNNRFTVQHIDSRTIQPSDQILFDNY